VVTPFCSCINAIAVAAELSITTIPATIEVLASAGTVISEIVKKDMMILWINSIPESSFHIH